MAIKPTRTKPYTPQTNGKAERFIKTLLNEWAYAITYQISVERNHWLPRYLGLYGGRRSHMALGGLSPQQQLKQLLGAECPGEKAQLSKELFRHKQT
jgi:transposase InsO family protein